MVETAREMGSQGTNGTREEDLALCRAAAAGDREARSRLATRMYDRVGATVRCLCAGHRDEDDFVHCALAEIISSAGSFEARSSLQTWAARIAVRKTLRLLGQRRRRDRAVMADADAGREVGQGGEQDRSFFVRRQIGAAFARLPDKLCETLVLRLVHGMGPDEIAAALEIPRPTARQRIRIGRRRLAEILRADPVFLDWIERRPS